MSHRLEGKGDHADRLVRSDRCAGQIGARTGSLLERQNLIDLILLQRDRHRRPRRLRRYVPVDCRRERYLRPVLLRHDQKTRVPTDECVVVQTGVGRVVGLDRRDGIHLRETSAPPAIVIIVSKDRDRLVGLDVEGALVDDDRLAVLELLHEVDDLEPGGLDGQPVTRLDGSLIDDAAVGSGPLDGDIGSAAAHDGQLEVSGVAPVGSSPEGGEGDDELSAGHQLRCGLDRQRRESAEEEDGCEEDLPKSCRKGHKTADYSLFRTQNMTSHLSFSGAENERPGKSYSLCR